MSGHGWPAALCIGPDDPPVGATLAASGIAWSWSDVDEPDRARAGLLVWHWCDHRLWLAEGRDPELVGPDRWVPVGAAAHDLISRDPLHLEPSVYWPDCCGRHGWLRDGVWTDA